MPTVLKSLIVYYNIPPIPFLFYVERTNVMSKYEYLMKFGWKEIGEVTSDTSIETISQAILLIVTIFCLRDGSSSLKENSLKSLKYLNLVGKSSLEFPFLFHYLHGEFSCNFYFSSSQKNVLNWKK